MPIHTHLMLVSDQPTPNLTPAIDQTIKPERVILLVSANMNQRAQWLAEIYRPRGIQVEHWPIDNAWNIAHIQERVLALLERENTLCEQQALALNATGGTKPMSIAAYEAFRAWELPIYYVHPDQDELIWLYPENQPPHSLEDRVRIKDFLLAHGAQIQNTGTQQVPPTYRELAQRLIDDIDYFADALGVLNWYANSAERDLHSVPLDNRHANFDAFQDLTDAMEAIHLLRVQNGKLVFPDQDARFFANGGWLEQYVFASLNGLKKELPIIQDTASSIELIRGEGQSKNELDIAFLANNRFHLIECKAKRFDRGQASSGSEALYKLDSLADTIGGLKAKAMLISYKPLPKHDAQRARDLRIEVLQGKQLQALPRHLRQWITKGKP